MATITDPILGVPSTILDIPDYQHEYVNTPVPYADMLPVPQPPRGLVYPDNVPPVLANLNAMHPTNRQAQTLNTDGNHALLVSDVSGGGAGAGSYGADSSDIQYVTASSLSTELTAILNNAHVGTLYRVMVTIAWDADIINAGEAPSSRIFLRSSPNGAQTPIGVLWGIARPGVAVHNAADNGVIEILYPGGWVNPWFIDPTDTQLIAVCQQNDFVSGLGIAADWKAR